MTNATRVVPEVWAGDTGKAPEDSESHAGRTESKGKSAGWKLALAAALKSRTTATISHDRDEPLAQHGVVFRQAADQGKVFAQGALGFAYRFGEGVAKDSAEAVKWYDLGKKVLTLNVLPNSFVGVRAGTYIEGSWSNEKRV